MVFPVVSKNENNKEKVDLSASSIKKTVFTFSKFFVTSSAFLVI